MTHEFDDIRPYNDLELPEALRRIAASDLFERGAAFVCPNVPLDSLRRQFTGHTSVQQFQETVMRQVVESIVADSVSRLTLSGVDQLDPRQPCLFISNHRDIVLDALLLQYLLYQHGHPMFQATFGSNLMENPVVCDLGRCNRMFRTERDSSNPRRFFAAMQHLSAYIRHTLTESRESVWIAQRNGRTKDGRDATEVALLKMLGMSGPRNNPAESYAQLHIVPVTVAYEWEPCDTLKAIELCRTRHEGHYTKAPGEDTHSILSGIVQPKGHVHFSINRPIAPEELRQLPAGNDFHHALAQLLDSRINAGYHLMPTNLIARDMQREEASQPACLQGEKPLKGQYQQGKEGLPIQDYSTLGEDKIFASLDKEGLPSQDNGTLGEDKIFASLDKEGLPSQGNDALGEDGIFASLEKKRILFEQRLAQLPTDTGLPAEELRAQLIAIYANPAYTKPEKRQ